MDEKPIFPTGMTAEQRTEHIAQLIQLGYMRIVSPDDPHDLVPYSAGGGPPVVIDGIRYQLTMPPS